jgi:membrane associated rhomboid family serine protease
MLAFRLNHCQIRRVASLKVSPLSLTVAKFPLKRISFSQSSKSFSTNRSFTNNFNSESFQNKLLYTIIGANVLVFGAWNYADNDRSFKSFMMKHFTISSYSFFNLKHYHTLLTNFFSHKDLAHIMWNMIAFYTFGSTVLQIAGTGRFLLLYFGGGIVSGLCQILWPSIVPQNWPAKRHQSPYTAALGASGAVNALALAYVILAPRSTIYIWGVLPIPAALFGIAYVGFDVWSLYTGDSGIGNAAHLGKLQIFLFRFILVTDVVVCS